MVANGVLLDKIGMKNKEAIIRYLTRKNKTAFSNLTITWIGCFRAVSAEKTIGSIIFEVTNSETGNWMMDEKIVIGS